MANLVDILREEVRKYASNGRSAKARLFPLLNDSLQTYAVNAVGEVGGQHISHVVVLARLVNDQIVIEEDKTDKPLFEALEQCGIPRERIVLAYAGETVPDAETYRIQVTTVPN